MEQSARTYRSKDNVVVGAGMFVLGLFFTIGYLQDSMEPAFRAIWALVLAYWLGVGFRLTRTGVRSSDRGVRVVNVFSSFDLRWEEISGFRIGRWKLLPCACLIDLKGGGTKVAFGIQEKTNFPNGSAERTAEMLNAELKRVCGSLGHAATFEGAPDR
jgi:hypothetical protein